MPQTTTSEQPQPKRRAPSFESAMWCVQLTLVLVYEPVFTQSPFTNTQTQTHRHTHTDRHTHRHTQTHTDTHRHTQTHTDTHTLSLRCAFPHSRPPHYSGLGGVQSVFAMSSALQANPRSVSSAAAAVHLSHCRCCCCCCIKTEMVAACVCVCVRFRAYV